MTLAAGTKLGRYEILAPLGQGGMAEVYKARDLRLGREVAVKVLPDQVADRPERLARFEREARTVAGLNHPNIVVLHSIEEEEGVRFLTMELVAGKTLDQHIQASGLSPQQVLALAIPLAEALAAAHDRGVVHRDLKPRNVMVTEEGRVKVLDFGLAKLSDAEESRLSGTSASTISVEGQILGTVPYMAPEQIRGDFVDARTDLFAMGTLLYELASGRRPFEGRTVADVASAILRDTPLPLSERRPDLGEGFDEVVGRCLEKDPGSRFGSARELVQALRALVEGEPRAGAAARPGVIRSLAVLPFDNVSRDPAQEYFADGMTEALISDLSRLGDLRVISRTSVMRYKGAHRPLPEIARELDVDAILEGSALLVGQRVRVSVQLVSARRDQTLWSERYDRDLEDVLSLQSQVAEAVVREIAVRVSPREANRLARRAGVNPEAHLEYLKGKHNAEATSPQAIELSVLHFRRALALDPALAPAWAGLAGCHSTRAMRGMAPPAEANAEALAAASKALSLDDSLAEAHVVLAQIQAREGGVSKAIASLRRAIDLNPGLSSAYAALGRLYYCTERHSEAQEAMLKSVSLDPLSMIHHTSVGDAYYYAREYAPSVDYYRKAIVLDPRFDGAHTDLARSLEALGRFDEARAEYQEGRRLGGSVAGPSFGLAHLEASMGHTDAARTMLAELEAARGRRVVSAWGIAALHASLGDVDQAFEWLETAIREGATGVIFLRVHPRLDLIRDDPRYRPMVHRLGLDA